MHSTSFMDSVNCKLFVVCAMDRIVGKKILEWKKIGRIRDDVFFIF